MSEESHPDQEGFGEAGLGEAQSSDPPDDPEMIHEDPGNEGDVDEQTGADPGAEEGGEPDRGEGEEGPTES